MAITIHKNPPNPAPVHNPMVLKVSSDNANEEQFSVIADINVNDELMTRLRIPLNPDGFAVFDIHKHIQNEIQLYKGLDPDEYEYYNFAYLTTTGGFGTYSVNLSEEYKAYFAFSEVLNSSGNAYLVTQTTPIFEIGDVIDVVTSDVASYNQSTTITNIVENFPDYYIYTTLAYNGDASGTYSLSNNELTIFPTGASVSNYFAWDSCFDNDDFIAYMDDNDKFNEYFGDGTTLNNKFSTNMPDGWEIDRDGILGLNIVYDPSEYTTLYPYLEWSDGTTADFITIHNSQSSMSLVGFGPQAFSAPYPQDEFFEYEPPAGVTSAICEIRDEGGNTIFGPLTYRITENCTKYERVTLVFKDQRGSYVPFSFDLVSRHTKDIERTTYTKERGLEYYTDNTLAQAKTHDRGKRTIDTKVTDRYIITSNWVNQTTSDYLMELFESPDVYWYKRNDTLTDIYPLLYPVTITDTSVERKQTINDLIINYTLSFEMSVKNPKIR